MIKKLLIGVFIAIVFIIGTAIYVRICCTEPFYSYEKTYNVVVPKHVSVFLVSTIKNN